MSATTITPPIRMSQPTMAEEKPGSTAIATRQTGPVVDIVSPFQFNEYVVAKQREHAHVLTPVTSIGSLPEMWKIVPTLVYLNPDPASGDVYRDPLFCEGDEVAPTKVGLRKIAQAAALNTRVFRLDSTAVPNLWEFLGRIRWRGFDAQFHEFEAPHLWDLRDGSEFVKRLRNAAERNRKRDDKRPVDEIIKKQLDAARFHGYRNGASRAVNAAIREFGLRQKYTRAELAKPFVCFAMVVNPDMSDPEQRRIVLHAALGAADMLYPQRESPKLSEGTDPLAEDDPAVNHATGEIIEADQDRTASPASSSADSDSTLHTVTRVVRDNTPNASPKYSIFTEQTGDRPLCTDDDGTAQHAAAARRDGEQVALDFSTGPKGTWIEELRRVSKDLPRTTEL